MALNFHSRRSHLLPLVVCAAIKWSYQVLPHASPLRLCASAPPRLYSSKYDDFIIGWCSRLGPQQKDDGTVGWTLPIDPSKKVIHMSDINDLGKVVAGAFLHPETVGDGRYLSLATELNRFNDIVAAYKASGKHYTFTPVPGAVFSTFFEGAKELAEMFGYFGKYTYMGPNASERIELARQIANRDFTSFEQWLKGGGGKVNHL